MTYQEFYAHIDCRFLYHDTAAWQQLIAQSLEIGGNVPFLVLHESKWHCLRVLMSGVWSMRNITNG